MTEENILQPSSFCQSLLTGPIDGWSLIVAVNDREVLNSTLLRSPVIDHRCEIIIKEGYRSASTAYNAGAAEANNEILVFAHSDVYLPPGWLNTLIRSLALLSELDPNWGVLGICGISRSDEIVGHVFSTGSQRTFGNDFEGVIEASSLDEVILILRRSAKLRFDEKLPGFHLYGTDICLEASRLGMKSYIMAAFCIHNSNGIRSLPFSFWRSYCYLRTKWYAKLPIRSCCTVITKRYWPFLRAISTALGQVVSPSPVGKRCANVEQLYSQLLTSEQSPGQNAPWSANGS